MADMQKRGERGRWADSGEQPPGDKRDDAKRTGEEALPTFRGVHLATDAGVDQSAQVGVFTHPRAQLFQAHDALVERAERPWPSERQASRYFGLCAATPYDHERHRGHEQDHQQTAEHEDER